MPRKSMAPQRCQPQSRAAAVSQPVSLPALAFFDEVPAPVRSARSRGGSGLRRCRCRTTRSLPLGRGLATTPRLQKPSSLDLLQRKVECSFPEHAKHYKGCVIGTFCGRISNIGHDCGRKCIENYASLESGLNKAKDRGEQRERLRNAPAHALARLKALQLRAGPLARFQRGLQRHLPALFETLEKYPPGRAMVEVPLPKSEISMDEGPGRGGGLRMRTKLEPLYGTEIADPSWRDSTAAELEHRLLELRSNVAAGIELKQHASLFGELRKCETRLLELESLIGASANFFTGRNMNLLLRAADLAGLRMVIKVEVIDETYRFISEGKPFSLGRRGQVVMP